jgi:two-component system, chemotaxis family, protein-glutamate methylesterase/glutaminase
MPNIRVLVVDDSAPMRLAISSLLSEEPDLQVVGMAPNGRVGVDKIAQVHPDVVLLDVEMPVMDGMTALKLMRKDYPSLPIIMFSAVTQKGAVQTLEALALGAGDYVPKPSMQANLDQAMESCKSELVPKIRALCERTARANTKTAAAHVLSPAPRKGFGRAEVVALVCSTGGPKALEELLPKFPASCPVPIVIVLTMLPIFITTLVENLRRQCAMKVMETGDAHPLTAGIYFAAGGKHTFVERAGGQVQIRAAEGAPVNFNRPSADILLQSLADVYGGNCMVGILTGSGNNGLKGCADVYARGGEILVQDQASSTVGAAAAAVLEAGLAHSVFPLNEFYDQICKRILATKSSSANGAW